MISGEWKTDYNIAMKILGGAAFQGYSFGRCVEIGKSVNSQLVSLGSALDHCHVPGRQTHETIPDNVCVIGAGIHNEPVCTMDICSLTAGPSLTYF